MMSQNDNIQLDNLYSEGEQWVQNLGEKTVHAKRMPGKFRLIKWLAMLVWTPFFLAPYLTWNGKQAILFDVANRQYHLFEVTIFPQDMWMLAMVLLFLAILLAVMTTVLGRVFCGYFCFQTVWTDVFTKIETWIEGAPAKRRKLDESPWNGNKIQLKTFKHLLWLMIAIISGVTWTLYFGTSWVDYLTNEVQLSTWAVAGAITLGVYVFAGFMREQTCLWVCPYARIQGAMVDTQSILPTYDYHRGEQRGKLAKGKYLEGQGDCIDCHQCVAVCPTGVDIRKGQEYGCITCGLCIDACDSVMQKVGKATGLIRYMSLDEIKFKQTLKAIYKRPRVIVYSAILGIALGFLLYGLSHIARLDLTVLHDRRPLFVQLSDGSIRNKYLVKVMNKTDQTMAVALSFRSKIKQLKSQKTLGITQIEAGDIKTIYVYLSARAENVGADNSVVFVVREGAQILEYEATFFTPRSMR